MSENHLARPSSGDTDAPSAVGAVVPVRQQLYRKVYQRLSQRLASAGAVSWLVTPGGDVMAGPAPAPEAMRPSAETTTPGRRAGAVVVYAPLGQGGADVYLAVEAESSEAARTLRITLPWLIDDSLSLAHLETAVAQTGDRLVGAYEQMHAMFGLARLLDGQSDAYGVVLRVLQEMCAVLDFGWLAVRFSEHPKLRSEVSGRLICCGRSEVAERVVREAEGATPPPPAALLAETAEQLLLTGLTRPYVCPPATSTLGGEYVAVPVRQEGRLMAVLLAGGKGGEDPDVSSFDLRFLVACGDLIGVFHENLSYQAEQRALFMGMVRALTASIDAKHRYTRGHSERVSMLAGMMATAMGLPEPQVRAFRLAGLLHDVGKIGIPEAILSKPTRLTDEEFEVIKRHPVIGYEILRGIPGLEDVLPGVLHHHEQYGGRGYPEGLAGEAIPLIGRVLALCDTFDAMSSSRSYRAAMSRETVLAEISRCAGRQFDPILAKLFITLDFAPFDALFDSHGEETATSAAA